MRPVARGLIVLALVASALAAPPNRPARALEAELSAYQGLGAWVDLYDPHLMARPEGTVAALARRGVRTLFLETSNYQMPEAVMNRGSVGRYLDAAHAAGIRVVAWYVPGFTDLELDLERSLAAIRFRSASGEAFDGFGMDIESTRVAEYWVRSNRAVALSRRLRDVVGPDYALGAIVLPPPLLDVSPTYWPAFPWKELGRIYDVFLPMGYWTFRYSGPGAAYEFTRASIEGIRARTGRPAVPIHPIGGIADRVGGRTARAFVRAVRDHGAIGGSFYDVGTSSQEDWSELADIAVTPVQNLPSPLALGKRFGEYGHLPAGDRSHPRDVVFRTGRHTGAWELDYEVFGMDAGKVSLLVNWKRVTKLGPGALGWSGRRTIALPRGALSRPRNTIMFTVGDAESAAPEWGVRGVSLVPSPLPATDRSPHGNLPGGETVRADRVTYRLPPTSGLTTVTAAGFDVSAGEIAVSLNGRTIGLLTPTADGAWGVPTTFVIPPVVGTGAGGRLTFDAVAFPPERTTWGVRLIDISGMSLLPGI